MLRASLSSMRSRPSSSATPSGPSKLQSRIISYLQAVSKRACTHPIHTIVFVAILASTTYIALLESSLFEPPAVSGSPTGRIDFSTFLTGSKALHLGPDTDWKWQNGEDQTQLSNTPVSTANTCSAAMSLDAYRSKEFKHHALLTLVFPETVFDGEPVPIPQKATLSSLANTTSLALPSSKNLLSPISQETTLAYSTSYESAEDFLSSVQELSIDQNDKISRASGSSDGLRWVLSAKRASTSLQRSFKRRVLDAWTAFVDLLKVRCSHI